MSNEDLKYARWLIANLERDQQQQLQIRASSWASVEAKFDEVLSDDVERAPFIDQVLRLAHGVFTEAGEVELARSIVKLILSHPAGREQLQKNGAGRAWAKFVDQKLTAPSVEAREPPPEGSISVKSLVNKSGKFRL